MRLPGVLESVGILEHTGERAYDDHLYSVMQYDLLFEMNILFSAARLEYPMLGVRESRRI